MLPENLHQLLWEGTVIPAHPLALHEDRSLNEQRQRALTRYYLKAGAGGIAVGVHTTQFEIRDPQVNLYRRVLELAAEEVSVAALDRPFLQVAGICGPTEQAVKEAELAKSLGYQVGLLSMGGLQNYTEKQLLERTRRVGEIIPVFGFYLQPSVGGRIFTYRFWEAFVDIPQVVAIKVASFNRYQTLDVVRALAFSNRWKEVALYTGNDDNIVADLLTPYVFNVEGSTRTLMFRGGLLGHWSVWTQKAVTLMERIKRVRAEKEDISSLLAEGVAVTDSNAAFFDPANQFHGCIAGLHEVLRRQGLMEGTWCLNPKEKMSPGQSEEIDRVYRQYPWLNDDQFVQQHLAEFLR